MDAGAGEGGAGGKASSPMSSSQLSAVRESIREAKAGLVGYCPGDSVVVDVSSERPSERPSERRAKASSAFTSAGTALVRPFVALDYWTSWRRMGRAELRCVGGCTCEPLLLDGHAPEDKASLRSLAVVEVSSLHGCALNLTILPSSSSGEHRFRLARLSVGGHVPLPAMLSVLVVLLWSRSLAGSSPF